MPGLTTDQPIDYLTSWRLKQSPEGCSLQNLKLFKKYKSRVAIAGWKGITKVKGKDLSTQLGPWPLQTAKS